MAISLSSCGFQLRGNTVEKRALFAFQTLYIESLPSIKTALILRRNIGTALSVQTNQSEAQVQISFLSESTQKQVLSIDKDGRVREYKMIYELNYRITSPDLPSTLLRLSRDYTYDDTKVLAKESEEQILLESLQEDAAQQIVRTLSGLKKSDLIIPLGN